MATLKALTTEVLVIGNYGECKNRLNLSLGGVYSFSDRKLWRVQKLSYYPDSVEKRFSDRKLWRVQKLVPVTLHLEQVLVIGNYGECKNSTQQDPNALAVLVIGNYGECKNLNS